MFSDKTFEPVGFASTWQKKSTTGESSSQTEPPATKDSEVQAPERSSVEIQTDLLSEVRIHESYDENALASYLSRIVPAVLQELDKNATSHAFDNYNPFGDDDQSYNVSLLKTFTSSDVSEEFQVTDLSWNSSGSIIAVAFGAKQHAEWCDHENVKLLCWNLDRIKDANKPCSIIELDTCVTSISFHPTLSSVIAVGDFSGRVVIYSTSEDEVDLMIGASGVTDEETTGHREPVTSLYWIKHREKPSSSEYQLVSGSLDGKILIWTLKNKEQILEAEEGFQILAGNLPVKLSKDTVRSSCEVGITSISQNCEDPAIIVISTEGGGIFQCNLNSSSIAGSSIPSPIPLRNPLVFGYTAHKSHTCSSEFSLIRNVFVSSGFDGQIAIYSLLQPKPLLIIQRDVAVSSVRWSPIRPLVFIATSYDGKLLLFDLDTDQTSPVAEVPVLEGSSKRLSPMTCAEFNTKDPKLVASANEDGKVFIWKLSSRFVSQGVREKEILKALADVGED